MLRIITKTNESWNSFHGQFLLYCMMLNFLGYINTLFLYYKNTIETSFYIQYVIYIIENPFLSTKSANFMKILMFS